MAKRSGAVCSGMAARGYVTRKNPAGSGHEPQPAMGNGVAKANGMLEATSGRRSRSGSARGMPSKEEEV